MIIVSMALQIRPAFVAVKLPFGQLWRAVLTEL
jgi:hypothetical protein